MVIAVSKKVSLWKSLTILVVFGIIIYKKVSKTITVYTETIVKLIVGFITFSKYLNERLLYVSNKNLLAFITKLRTTIITKDLLK